MNFWFKISVVFFLAIPSVNAVGVDIVAGEAKASSACVACHGANGNSANPAWPKLAGQNSAYLVKQLQDFKSNARKDAMMAGQAQALSDSDIANVANYFSLQKISSGKAANLNGERLYRSGDLASGAAACAACHGADGKGNKLANFPRLAGQHATYTEKVLKDFRSGARTNDINGMMQGVAKSLSDQQIADISQYIQGIK